MAGSERVEYETCAFAFRTESRLDLSFNEEQPGFIADVVKLALAMSYTAVKPRPDSQEKPGFTYPYFERTTGDPPKKFEVTGRSS